MPRFSGRDIVAEIMCDTQTAAAGVITSAFATTPAGSDRRNYVRGFSITGLGATGATTVEATLTGVGANPMKFTIAVPAGVSTAITPLVIVFGEQGLPAATEVGAITLSVPSFGSGNTKVATNMWGYRA